MQLTQKDTTAHSTSLTFVPERQLVMCSRPDSTVWSYVARMLQAVSARQPAPMPRFLRHHKGKPAAAGNSHPAMGPSSARRFGAPLYHLRLSARKSVRLHCPYLRSIFAAILHCGSPISKQM